MSVIVINKLYKHIFKQSIYKFNYSIVKYKLFYYMQIFLDNFYYYIDNKIIKTSRIWTYFMSKL